MTQNQVIEALGMPGFMEWLLRGRTEADEMIAKFRAGRAPQPEAIPHSGTPLSCFAWYHAYVSGWNAKVFLMEYALQAGE